MNIPFELFKIFGAMSIGAITLGTYYNYINKKSDLHNENANIQHKKEIYDIEQHHKKVVDELETKHKKEINDIEQHHKNVIDEIETKHKNLIYGMEIKHKLLNEKIEKLERLEKMMKCKNTWW
jgi:hypothetical protein